MRLVMQNPRPKPRKLTPLVRERLAELADHLIKVKQSRKLADANRPQAKTAVRKAFEREFSPAAYNYTGPVWDAFQLGWRLARGCQPTKREGAT